MWGKVICDGAMIHSSSKTWSETRRDGLYKCITCRNSGRRADFHVQTFGFIGNSLSSASVSNHRGIRAPYLSRFLQQTSTYFVHSHKHFTLRCQWDIFFHRIAEKTKKSFAFWNKITLNMTTLTALSWRKVSALILKSRLPFFWDLCQTGTTSLHIYWP